MDRDQVLRTNAIKDQTRAIRELTKVLAKTNQNLVSSINIFNAERAEDAEVQKEGQQ